MRRQIKLLCARDVAVLSSSVQPATSPYPFSGSGSIKVCEAWNTVDAGGDATGTFAYVWPGNSGGNQQIVGFEPAPTLALFEKLTFSFGVDYSQTGPNTWWMPPDNSFVPKVAVVLLGRDGVTQHFSPYYDLDSGEDNNVNISTDPGLYKLHTVSWELTAHPEGGPFTLDDVNKIAAGFDAQTSNGPNGKAYEVVSGSFFKIRVPWFTLTADIQDLGGDVRAQRHSASTTLRLMRHKRNSIFYSIPEVEAARGVGDVVNIAAEKSPEGPDAWGPKVQERRSGMIVQRTYWPEAMKVVDESFDLDPFSCEMWAAYRIPIPWTPELSGIAYLDRAGDWTMVRAQDAWSLRPGDGVALRVLEDYLNLSEEGLAIHSANGQQVLLNSSNPTVSPWLSVGVSGGLTFSAETDFAMVEELGYTTAVRATFGGTPGIGWKAQAFSLTAGDRFSIRARVRNVSVDDPDAKFMELAIVTPLGDYWDEATRSWISTPTYTRISSEAGFGELAYDQIPAPDTGIYSINIGRISAAINTATFVLALADVQVAAHGCGMPLVTLASPITRVADVLTFDNSGDFTFWHRSSGVAIVEFRPFWRSDGFDSPTEKQIIKASHSGGYFDELRWESDGNKFVAERNDSGGSQTIEIELLDSVGDPLTLTRAHYVRVFFRWLGADGWFEHAPREAALGYAVYLSEDDSLVSFHETTADWSAPDSAVEDEVTIEGLDGWVRWVEIKRLPITAQQAIWKR